MTKQEALAQLMRAQMDEESRGLGDRIPDDATVASWLIIGLTGCVSMLQRMTRAGIRLPEYWTNVVCDSVDHLADVVRIHRERS